jgi:predicted nucleic acid-binding protein
MNDRVFVDTAVLIYAHDVDAGTKHDQAEAIVRELWTTRLGALSTQVLQEFYVNATRKIRQPLERALARRLVRFYSAWRVERIGPAEILEASTLEEEHEIGFWDALIVVAAVNSGASRLLSEDLGDGQVISGVRVENPFRSRPA